MNIPLNINWQQILLHLFNFVILVGGLYILLYKPVRDFMEKRTKTYEEMDESARKSLAEAEDKVKEYESRISGIEDEISSMKQKASAEAAASAAEQIKSAEKQASQIILKAKNDAESEREKIIAGANDEIKNIIMDATKKLTDDDGTDYLQKFLDLAKDETGNE